MKIDVFLVISILIQMVASIHLLSVQNYCGQPPHRAFSPPLQQISAFSNTTYIKPTPIDIL